MTPLYTLRRGLLLAAAMLVAIPANAATIVVNQNNNDIVNGDAFCNLREAIQSSNTDTAVGGCTAGSGQDTITFAPTITGPIPTRNGYEITEGVTIDGTLTNIAGPRVVIGGGGRTRLFTVSTSQAVQFNSISFRQGRATTGGAIFITTNGALVITDGEFMQNVATQDGGAIFIANGGAASCDGCTFTANRALGDQPGLGGGAITNSGTFTIVGGTTFTRNQAVSGLGNGGAILNRSGATLNILGGSGSNTFSDNRAARAGGAIENIGTADITLSDFQGNRAGINGGGIHTSASGTVIIRGGSMTNNVALGEGGALWNSAAGRLTVEATSFSGNLARGDESDQGGGAIYTDGGPTSVTGATITVNSANGASGSGGGILSKDANLTVSGTTFANNTANRAGGAIEVVGGVATLTDNTFQANIASRAPGNGGAIHGGGSANSTVTDGLARGNRATEGGAFWISAMGTLTVDGTTIEQNTARGDDSDQGGGGVYSDGGTVVLIDAAIDQNRAGGTAGSGGGVLINGGTFVARGSTTITNNVSNRAGGGIELNGATSSVAATVRDAIISGNRTGSNTDDTAPGNGGGIHAGGAVMLTVEMGSMNTNQANEGGGLWISAGTQATVTGTSFANNTAWGDDADQGGGGFYNEAGHADFVDAVFEDNIARGVSGSGGGILNNDGTVTVRGGSMTGNVARRAGGAIEDRNGVFPTGPSLTLASMLMADNRAESNPGNGGGLHVSGPGDVRIDSLTVRGNFASNEGGGLWNSGSGRMIVTYTTLETNEAGQDGGGFFQQAGDDGFSRIEQSLFRANVAGFRGGGLESEGGIVSVLNSTFAFNEARRGGGGFTQDSEVILSNVTVARNTASNGGGWSNPTREMRASMDNSIFADNTASGQADQLSGFYASRGYNLVESRTGSGIVDQMSNDIYDTDPMLGPLADNGGPTLTFSLMAGSPAIDAGWTGLRIDQRGAPRGPSGMDIGAFEFGATPPSDAVVAQVETAAAPLTAALASLEMDGPVRLDAAAPNPMRDASRMQFAVREAQAVTIDLYDVMGRRVQSLYSGSPEALTLVSVEISSRDLAAGVYVVVLSGETVRASQQVTVVR